LTHLLKFHDVFLLSNNFLPAQYAQAEGFMVSAISSTKLWTRMRRVLKYLCIFVITITVIYGALWLDAFRPWKSKDILSPNFDFARFDRSSADGFREIAAVLAEAIPLGTPQDTAEMLLLENADLTRGSVVHRGGVTHRRYNYNIPTLRNPTGLGAFWISVDYDSKQNVSQVYIMRVPVFASQPTINNE
jgi:hypothetical protein